MTSRANIWDGTNWVSMTGGAGEGDSDPDDFYLRLDGANNPAAPSNFLRQSDGDLRYSLGGHTHTYLPLTGGTLSGKLFLDDGLWISNSSPKGSIFIGTTPLGDVGDGDNLLAWSGSTGVVSRETLSTFSRVGHTHTYLPLAGGALTGPVTTNASGGNVTHEEFVRSVMVKPISVGGATPAPSGGNGTLMLKYDDA